MAPCKIPFCPNAGVGRIARCYSAQGMLLSLLLLSALHLQTQHRKHAPPPPPPPAAEKPLPNPAELIARARATFQSTFDARENYLCQVHTEQDDLNPGGGIKSRHTRDEESFFVNGHVITRTLARDGQALTPSETKKEDVRVQHDTKKYADPSQREKSQSAAQQQLNSALRMLNFTNERREIVLGRPTIVFDVKGNPDARPNDLTDRFMQAMQGVIRFDEASGHIMELNVKSDKDVRIMGGLLATVHKDSSLHLEFKQQKDGVWLLNLIDAAGDGRAALFLHPAIRFHQTQGDCHLYGVQTTETERPPAAHK